MIDACPVDLLIAGQMYETGYCGCWLKPRTLLPRPTDVEYYIKLISQVGPRDRAVRNSKAFSEETRNAIRTVFDGAELDENLCPASLKDAIKIRPEIKSLVAAYRTGKVHVAPMPRLDDSYFSKPAEERSKITEDSIAAMAVVFSSCKGVYLCAVYDAPRGSSYIVGIETPIIGDVNVNRSTSVFFVDTSCEKLQPEFILRTVSALSANNPHEALEFINDLYV